MNCQACGHENVDEARFCASCGAALPTRVESQHDPLIGQVIGNRYRITGIIGEGGMGVVYVGEQQMGSTIRKVAVKTLHPHLSKDASVLKRFHRECGTVAQLEHPNTIKVYDFGSTPDGTLYIAMEFVAGRALSDVLLKDGKLSPDRVTQILRQICGALDEAHQLGIVHRDLKPDNIILTPRAGEQDFVKVLDFGIAARTESTDAAHEQKLTQQGTVLGTPPYMSPEQFTGKSLDRRSDVYSLGVMAYEMLTGRLPFEAETPWQWATQHMTAQPIPFEQVAPQIHVADAMRQAILRSLSKEADQRQASAGEFFSELSTGLKQGTGAGPIVPAAAALSYQATAAMPEMPGFGNAMTPVVAQAAPVGSTIATPAVPAAVAAVAAPAFAARRPRGGKVGLILGLSGAGLAIAAVMAVMLVRSNKPTDDPAMAASVGSASAAPAVPATLSAEIPQDTAAQATGQATPPVAELAVAHTPTKTPGKTAGSAQSPSSTSAKVSPASTPTPAVLTPPTQPTQPTAAANSACDNCIAAASSGDIVRASQYFGACTDSAAKAKCQGLARGNAIRAALGAMQNHDCGKIQQIANAISGMGETLPAVQNAANNCR